MMQAVLPGMRDRRAGVIVNVSSSTTMKPLPNGGFPKAYAGFVQQTMAAMQQHAASDEVTTAQDVAQAVFRAATDPDCPMILPAGADAIAWSKGR